MTLSAAHTQTLAGGAEDGGTEDAGAEDSSDQPTSAAELLDLERSQIGHDLHDTLLPLIFAASANLQPLLDKAVDPRISPQHRSRIEQTQQWLRDAMSVGRQLLGGIYPPELDQMTWIAAAKDCVGRFCGEACQVDWEFDPDSPVCDVHWDRELALCAYRVLVEAIRNAVRHGNAKHISIGCLKDKIVIADDGSGFEPDQVDRSHFGIRAMRGRARLVGQSLTVTSSPGGPTTVTLSFS